MASDYDTPEKKVSYGIGRQMGDQLLSNPFEGVDADAVIQGLTDSLKNTDSPISDDDFKVAFAVVSEKQEALAQEASEHLTKAGKEYLAENGARSEVTTTASGLQYEIITEGAGEKPGATDTVRTHYHGTLIDGSVFDSSVERNQPAEFPVNGVISGWTEALQMMPVGSKWRLVLPYDLAYGEHGAGGMIGPYSTLVFEVELLAIV